MRFTSIKFKELSEAKPQKLTSSEIKEFRYDGKEYSSQKLPGEASPVFLEILEKGAIILYQYFKSTGATGNTYIQKWYARKNNGPLVELKANWGGNSSRKERKAAFAALISDDTGLFAYYNDGNDYFDFGTLHEFIKEYNKGALAKKM